MEQLKCPNCGGNVDRERMICPYCGTQFKREHDPNILRIETYNPRTRVLETKVMFSEHELNMLGIENASEIMVHEMAKKIANSLVPFMEVKTSYDPQRFEHILRARVRVLEPDYRF